MIVQIFSLKGHFRSFSARNAILLRRQDSLPFGIRFDDFAHNHSSLERRLKWWKSPRLFAQNLAKSINRHNREDGVKSLISQICFHAQEIILLES
jgi:hypothetical protein